MSDPVLRPVRPSDIDVFEAAFTSAHGAGEFQWFGFRDYRAMRRDLDERGLLGGSANTLSIESEGALAGRIDWREQFWGRRDSSASWQLGVGILLEQRGRGIGTAAQGLLVDYLFAHTRAERIEASTDARNIAEQRCLEKVGFVREGTLRRAQWRGGAWHDQLLYSILRGEREA